MVLQISIFAFTLHPKTNKKNSKLGFGTRFGMILRVLAGKRYWWVYVEAPASTKACF